MAEKNDLDDYIYIHVRMKRDVYNDYKKLCKDNGDTVANNIRRYIFALVNQVKERQRS